MLGEHADPELRMTLADLLDTPLARDATGDLNLDALLARLDAGAVGQAAQLHEQGLGPWPGPLVLVTLRTSSGEETLPVALGRRAREALRDRLPDLAVLTAGDAPTPRDVPRLAPELGALLEATGDLPAEERAAQLMDFIMERIDASRCALVPFEGGSAGPPLAFHLRGDAPGSADPRKVPRAVIAHVARLRQPLASADALSRQAALPAVGTIAEQGVRSYLAVPVLFRGELLAVAYVDRLARAQEFTPDEQAAFGAFAYELARPLLALSEQRRRVEYDALRDHLLSREGGAGVARPPGPALAAVLQRADKLAAHATENLLLLGETGAGKEWLARHVHERGGRQGPFVAVNVSALPADLFESELLGSAKGAFTGAVDRPGRAEEAEGGTLFLDEIGDLDLANQVRLLRFLQDRRARRVGGRDERALDVRVVAATNRPVNDLVRAGTFRADLLHRFAPPLPVPPLRERREEILGLAADWLESRARATGLPPARVDRGARELLLAHPWPGNVRQLQAVLSHALLLADSGAITSELLTTLLEPGPTSEPPPTAGPERPREWSEFQRQQGAAEAAWLRERLAESGGRVETAARAIGCPASTLRNLLRKHGLR